MCTIDNSIYIIFKRMQRHLHLKMRTKLTKTRCIVIRQFLHAKMAKFKQLLINLRISIKDSKIMDHVILLLLL